MDKAKFDAFMQKVAEARTSSEGGGFSLKKGAVNTPNRNVFRILPPHPNMDFWCVQNKIHFSLGPKQDTASPCLEPFGEDCPICAMAESLRANARTMDESEGKQARDLAYNIRAQDRYHMNVVDMAAPERGVQKFSCSLKVMELIGTCFRDDDNKYRDITDPDTGRDIIIAVSTKMNTDYPQYDSCKAKDTSTPLPDRNWLKQLHDLSQENYKPTLDQVIGAMQGKRIQRGGQTKALAGALISQPAISSGSSVGSSQPAFVPPVSAPPPPTMAPPPGAQSSPTLQRGRGRPPKPQPSAAVQEAMAAAMAQVGVSVVTEDVHFSAPAPVQASADVSTPPTFVGRSKQAPASATPAPALGSYDSAVARAAAEVLPLGRTVDPNWTPQPAYPEAQLHSYPFYKPDGSPLLPECYEKDPQPGLAGDSTCRDCQLLTSCWAVFKGYLPARRPAAAAA